MRLMRESMVTPVCAHAGVDSMGCGCKSTCYKRRVTGHLWTGLRNSPSSLQIKTRSLLERIHVADDCPHICQRVPTKSFRHGLDLLKQNPRFSHSILNTPCLSTCRPFAWAVLPTYLDGDCRLSKQRYLLQVHPRVTEIYICLLECCSFN
jgi:hypothetical protein